MYSPGDDFLAGAGGTADKHGYITVRDHHGQINQVLHFLALVDHLFLEFQLAGAIVIDTQGTLHVFQHLGMLHGFGQKGSGAKVRRLDGVGDTRLAAEHDDRQ